ncbi:hypothetical protein Naga_100006g51 [Nannochloropsis gaditana]|uniref:Transmembrane protein n=1 Tax=Nannochloropsis gaditana TaxID=72520 RepID=W7U9G8_9STRA|nr:hypothetical protein Naga_100006g51 [Nannochloropsis gaditana]
MAKSTSATSTWSQALPPQYALLLGNLLVLANFIAALLVPWVEARYKVFDAWFPVYMPVKIGLLKCFGDMCSALYGETGQQQKGQGKGNDRPPIPGWGPTGGGGGSPINDSGGGAKALFEIAAIFAIIFLSVSVLVAMGGALVEAARVQGRRDISGLFPLQLSGASALICSVALLQYLFITLAGLHGGRYEVGFWLTLATAAAVGVLTTGQYLISKKFFDEEYTDGNGGKSFFLPSHLGRGERSNSPSGQLHKLREETTGCAKGCCGGGGGEGGGEASHALNRPSYGAV